MSSKIRIGLIGAGENTRVRHIPGFRQIPDVELTSVANRSVASAQQVARDFQIPQVCERWQDVVADPKIHAVCIGTWPNLHCEITLAALAAGKHVLCEARMARNLAEARQMLSAAQSHPRLVTQVVPSPFGLTYHNQVRQMIQDGFLGPLREAVIIGADDQFWDETRSLHWRQDAEISGNNILAMGILHETLSRFAPPTTRVFAQSAVFEPTRPHPTSDTQLQVTVPESVQIVSQFEGGGRGIYHLSGMILQGPGKQIHLYGRLGTIKLLFGAEEQLWCGRLGARELVRVQLPPEQRGGWRVEAEFINAIRGEEPVRFTTFDTGVKYMAFTEAVAESLASGAAVPIAL